MKPDNYIFRDDLDEADIAVHNQYPKAPGWLPVKVYDLKQGGYPTPQYGMMILDPDGGTNAEGQLLPPAGMWCKAEDVRTVLADKDAKIAAAQEAWTMLAGWFETPQGCRCCDATWQTDTTPEGSTDPYLKHSETCIVEQSKMGDTDL